MHVAILVKYHGYTGCREKSNCRKTSTHQKNWNGVGRWHKLGAAFCKSWSLEASSTKQQGRCLARLPMVRPLHSACYPNARHFFNVFVDAESSSARRARAQQYYALDGNRTTFHHYVPTNGGKIKSTQPVPLTGLIPSTSSYRLIDHIHSSQCQRTYQGAM